MLQHAQCRNSTRNAGPRPGELRREGLRRSPYGCTSYRRPTLKGMFPGGQPDMAQLLQQAQQMQQHLVAAQEELARTEVTGSAGGGLVTATMTGSGDVQAITIAKDAVDPDDVETLQDLVVAALHDAKRAADELAASTMGPLAGGLGGGGLGLPGL